MTSPRIRRPPRHRSAELAAYLVQCGVPETPDAETRKAALKWKYPCVNAIEFDSQEEDSGKFRFPVFTKRHEDKTVKDLQ